MSHAGRLTAPRHILRAAPEAIAAFADAPVGNIVDALGRSGAMAPEVRPMTRATRFAGTALPVDAGPRDNLAPWAALRLARPGDVLVIGTGGYTAASVCGDLMVGMARNAGIVAVVTDGAIRDVDGSDRVGIPVFAAAVSPNSPQKDGPGSVGLPVVVGSVVVAPGDIVCGDGDGVVVIPAARIGEATAALAQVRAKEVEMEAAVRDGRTAPAWLAGLPLDEIFRFVE